MSLADKVHLPGVAANILLAAGAVLLKPALDSLLISGFPDTSVTTLGGRIGDVTYSKGLSLLEPTVKDDIVAPFLRTTKPILSSMPLLQPSSMTAASGVMFGITACFLFLVAAGTFLVRSHAGYEPASGRPSSSSLSETLAYNREQRQAQNGRAASRRRGRHGREFSILFVSAILADKIHFDVFAAPDPMPPNNNQNNIPTEDIKPPKPSKSLTNHLSIFVTDCSLH
jgi:hypothetical protein